MNESILISKRFLKNYKFSNQHKPFFKYIYIISCLLEMYTFDLIFDKNRKIINNSALKKGIRILMYYLPMKQNV